MEDLNKKYLTKNECWGFAWAALGQGAVYAMMSSWIVKYYTDVLILPTEFIMILMWGARIWDAVNDPMMGTLVDKTRTRYGKMRPYLLITPIPIAILTILMFFNPGFSSKIATMIFASITYVLWGMIYTISDVPFWGLPSTMTPNPSERANFLSFARVLNGIGGALPLLLVVVLTSKSILGQENGYLVSAIFFAVGGMLLFSRSFFVTKERIAPQEKVPTLSENLRLVKKNRPLLLIVFFGILCFGRYMVQAAIPFVADYVFQTNINIFKNSMIIISAALVGIGMFPSMLIMPNLYKKFNYKQIAIGAAIATGVLEILFFIVGLLTHYNFLVAIPFLFFIGLPLGVFNVIALTMIEESLDYIEWKTWERNEGIAFSLQTFMNKFGAAMAAGIVPLVLTIIRYIQPIGGVPQVQNSGVKFGIFLLITLLPAVSMIFSVIPLFSYDYVGEKRDKILAELAERKAAIKE
jgi:sugar (glycoside-pentoside-hexuronide) transporter